MFSIMENITTGEDDSYRSISARSVDQSCRSDGTTPHMSGCRIYKHPAHSSTCSLHSSSTEMVQVTPLRRTNFAFSALTLLVGWQEGHPARKKYGEQTR